LEGGEGRWKCWNDRAWTHLIVRRKLCRKEQVLAECGTRPSEKSFLELRAMVSNVEGNHGTGVSGA
jgi:hypothetical protein